MWRGRTNSASTAQYPSDTTTAAIPRRRLPRAIRRPAKNTSRQSLVPGTYKGRPTGPKPARPANGGSSAAPHSQPSMASRDRRMERSKNCNPRHRIPGTAAKVTLPGTARLHRKTPHRRQYRVDRQMPEAVLCQQQSRPDIPAERHADHASQHRASCGETTAQQDEHSGQRDPVLPIHAPAPWRQEQTPAMIENIAAVSLENTANRTRPRRVPSLASSAASADGAARAARHMLRGRSGH
jgi:hypothetical protein